MVVKLVFADWIVNTVRWWWLEMAVYLGIEGIKGARVEQTQVVVVVVVQRQDREEGSIVREPGRKGERECRRQGTQLTPSPIPLHTHTPSLLHTLPELRKTHQLLSRPSVDNLDAQHDSAGIYAVHCHPSFSVKTEVEVGGQRWRWRGRWRRRKWRSYILRPSRCLLLPTSCRSLEYSRLMKVNVIHKHKKTYNQFFFFLVFFFFFSFFFFSFFPSSCFLAWQSSMCCVSHSRHWPQPQASSSIIQLRKPFKRPIQRLRH